MQRKESSIFGSGRCLPVRALPLMSQKGECLKTTAAGPIHTHPAVGWLALVPCCHSALTRATRVVDFKILHPALYCWEQELGKEGA